MSAYTGNFEHFTKGMDALSTGHCPGCEQCADDHGVDQDTFDAGVESGEIPNEGSFSWSGCDLCGSALGGTLEPYHYWDKETDTIVHGFGACVDCICYIANGDEPEVEGVLG